MHTYRFVFIRNEVPISHYTDILAANKKEAMKKWTSWKKGDVFRLTLIDIIKVN